MWIAVVAFDYGSLDEILGKTEILKPKVKKDSFTGSTNVLIDQIVQSSNKNSSKKVWDSVIETAWNEHDTVTNYVGYTLILFLWPVVLVLAQSRKILTSEEVAKKTCFILAFFLCSGLLMHLAFNWSYNYLNPSYSVIIPATTSEQILSSSNQTKASANSPVLASQTQTQPLIESTYNSEINYFREAINTASTAAELAQIAQSKQEWTEVALLWNKALILMKDVPSSSSNYIVAQNRINTYRENREIAKTKAAYSSL